MKKPLIAPSLLSADFGKLNDDVEMLNKSEADWFHIDVMDGIFVPNISFGFPVMKAIQKRTSKTMDVHLMISHPENYIERFHESGANNLTFHIELAVNHLELIRKIKSLRMKAGIAFNPDTPVFSLSPVISEVDLICLMSVHPGYGGQKFIPGTFQKISDLKKLISENNSSALIEIDGGVTLENAAELVKAGADVLVAGNTVFGSSNPTETISLLKNIS